MGFLHSIPSPSTYNRTLHGLIKSVYLYVQTSKLGVVLPKSTLWDTRSRLLQLLLPVPLGTTTLDLVKSNKVWAMPSWISKDARWQHLAKQGRKGCGGIMTLGSLGTTALSDGFKVLLNRMAKQSSSLTQSSLPVHTQRHTTCWSNQVKASVREHNNPNHDNMILCT